MDTTTARPQLMDLAAEHLVAAAHHAQANALGDLTSPWHSLAGQIRLVAGGISPVCDNVPVTPRPFGVQDHLDAALKALDSIPPGLGPPDLGVAGRRHPHPGDRVGGRTMTTTTLGDLLARANDLSRELRDSTDPVPPNTWESFDATAYLLMRELVGPARTGNRAVTLSHAALCRVLDAYPTPIRGATTGAVGAREAAHMLGRPRSAVIAHIRKGQIPAAWDGRRYIVDVSDLPSRDDVRPADPRNPQTLSRLSCTLGLAADLIAQNRDQLTRELPPGVESLDVTTAPVLAHVLGITHVAASHAVKVRSLNDVDGRWR